MLKRNIVSLSLFIKSKDKRYYWVPPNFEDSNKIVIIKKSNDIPKEVLDLMEKQEKNIQCLNDKLTNQQKVIENIHDQLEHLIVFSSNSRLLQVFNLFYIVVISFFKH